MKVCSIVVQGSPRRLARSKTSRVAHHCAGLAEPGTDLCAPHAKRAGLVRCSSCGTWRERANTGATICKCGETIERWVSINREA